MTHVTFAFRYAHEYYTSDVAPPPEFDRGLEFPGEKRPDYLDFVYFALVLGRTFQVSTCRYQPQTAPLGHATWSDRISCTTRSFWR